MCQVLNWALARSPGARSRAWARLASSAGGLFRLRCGVSGAHRQLVTEGHDGLVGRT